MHARIGRFVGGLVVATALVACSASSASAPPSSPTAAPAAPTAAPSVATTAPTTAPSPTPASAAPTLPAPSSASGADLLCAKEFEPCPLAAGTYSSSPFNHPFTFTVSGDGWTNDRAWPHGGSASTPKTAFLWGSGAASGKIDEVSTPIGPTPEDFIAHLKKFKGFTVSDPKPITVDGVKGSYVDVLSGTTGADAMYLIPEDAFNVAPGEKLRFIVLDKDGETVILILDAFQAADFDAFLKDVGQPLIDGLRWE
jgi:hypothetical protein